MDEIAEIPNLDEYIKDIKILAAKIYKKYAVKGMELEDLVSEGIVGLYDAYRRFDESRGVSFKTYSHYRIKGSMLDSIRRWLPCNHQTGREERIELITKFERYSIMEGDKRQQNELDDSINTITDTDLIDKLFSQLDKDDRKVIMSIVQGEKKLGEVADEMGIAKTKVVNMRNNALEKVKEEAENLGIEYDTVFNKRKS